jgi:small conductance mechanosensitive channel
MRRPFKKRTDDALDRMFETRTGAWEAVGLNFEVDKVAVRHARQRLCLTIPLLIAVVLLENVALNHISAINQANLAWDDHHLKKINHGILHPRHHHWFIGKGPITIAAVICVLVLGWLISRDLSRIAPAFFRRMDPSTAGTVGFLVRFLTVAATVLGALAVGGISLQAVAVGGAFTAVVLGLAAQQTLGNLFAGMVLLSARPFRLGERVRLQAGAVAGTIEGIVSGLGLLYTTLSRGEDRIMIPNNVVLNCVVVPLREPEAVDVTVTLGPGVSPSHVQEMLDSSISVATRTPPTVLLKEITDDSIVVRVVAVPDRARDGPRLADQVIAAVTGITSHRPGDEGSKATPPAADA